MPKNELVNVTRVSKVSDKTPTLRTSIPLDLAREVKVGDGDSISWVPIVHEGKKGLFVKKVE
jgi:hypothetical protein